MCLSVRLGMEYKMASRYYVKCLDCGQRKVPVITKGDKFRYSKTIRKCINCGSLKNGHKMGEKSTHIAATNLNKELQGCL